MDFGIGIVSEILIVNPLNLHGYAVFRFDLCKSWKTSLASEKRVNTLATKSRKVKIKIENEIILFKFG